MRELRIQTADPVGTRYLTEFGELWIEVVRVPQGWRADILDPSNDQEKHVFYPGRANTDWVLKSLTHIVSGLDAPGLDWHKFAV